MPLILTQHYLRDFNRYLDREGVIYHFPKVYLPLVKRLVDEFGDRRFLYQRPVKGAPPGQAGTYFGWGSIGDPVPDTQNAGHWFVDINDYRAMRPVAFRDANGIYYETGSERLGNLQGRSIRSIEPMRYFAILAAGQAYSVAPDTEMLDSASLQDRGVFAPRVIPKDEFREMLVVPPGVGYVPHGNAPPDPYEAASLHERARDDHQRTLDVLLKRFQTMGGSGLYNNHVDLFARLGERRFLIEAKSLPRPSVALDRMRYGVGQLMDYRVRYEAELMGAEPILAFGARVEREQSFIPTILDKNGIALVEVIGDRAVPGNERACSLPLF